MPKKNIVIVGYPKSGTTWLSRLMAELIECPLVGDWGFNEIQALYKEGEERDANYQCFKSHHTFDQLTQVADDPIFKVIYIVRDPRDIVISGMHYFNFSSRTKNILKKLKKGANSRFKFSEENKKKRMIHAVLKGDKKVNQWLEHSWKFHLNDYKKKAVLLVKYEDLLNNPQQVCDTILNYIEVKKKSAHILESINKQSFEKRKSASKPKDHPMLKKIIRKGGQGYWKTQFSEKEKVLFNDYLKETPYDF